MTGSDYAALCARVTASLNNKTYGRDGHHAFGACPACKVHVCITHHTCHKESKS